MSACVCVCVCMRAREREKISVVNILKFKGSLYVSDINIFIMCDMICCCNVSIVWLNNVFCYSCETMSVLGCKTHFK